MGGLIEKAVVALPSRLRCPRLTNKVMAGIGEGQAINQRGLQRCREASDVYAVVLCTDSFQLQRLAECWGFPVLITSVV